MRTALHPGHLYCEPHSHIISVWHYAHCWDTKPNAMPNLVTLSIWTHPIQRHKDQSLCMHWGFRRRSYLWISSISLKPCGYHTPNHKFLMTAVSAHSNDLMPCRLNQRFCELTIKGDCWSAMQPVGAAVWRMLLSQCWRQSESQAKGNLLCLSHDPIWPRRAFSLAFGFSCRG